MSECNGNCCDVKLTSSNDREEIQVNNPNTSGFGDNERFDEGSDVIDNYLEHSAGEINHNGIRVMYIAIKTNVSKDKITGEDPTPVAVELYNNNIRMKTDDEKLPSATNNSTQFGAIGWVDDMVYFMSKLDFRRKTEEINQTNDILKNYNININSEYNDWIPKSGDIIIVDLPPYYPTLEVIDVDDDFFHYLNVRPYWILTLESYTKKLIDFDYIENKYPTEWEIIKTMISPIDSTKTDDNGVEHSNHLIDSNEYLEDDERNMNSPNKEEDNLFDSIFG